MPEFGWSLLVPVILITGAILLIFRAAGHAELVPVLKRNSLATTVAWLLIGYLSIGIVSFLLLMLVHSLIN